jgi:hypothetical protein
MMFGLITEFTGCVLLVTTNDYNTSTTLHNLQKTGSTSLPLPDPVAGRETHIRERVAGTQGNEFIFIAIK